MFVVSAAQKWKQMPERLLNRALVVDRGTALLLLKLLSSRFLPEKYFQFGASEGAVKLPDEEICNMIDKTVQKYLRSNCGYCYSGTGDTFIAVFQSDENNINDYFVVVAKDYYEIDSCELEDNCSEEENEDG